ncbi:MAG: GntR family transcriptional regulator, partial [Firmicutes bacterium]|nr:GntR family transcriptional regulator [Bacillota bacterium]
MLDNDMGIPLYMQLYDKLKMKITGGIWPEGFLIPSETSLMKQYGVGRETVRRAVLRLV